MTHFKQSKGTDSEPLHPKSSDWRGNSDRSSDYPQQPRSTDGVLRRPVDRSSRPARPRPVAALETPESISTPELTAGVNHSWSVFITTLILAAAAAWLVRHIYRVLYPHLLSNGSLSVVWAITFLSIAWTGFLATLEKPRTATRLQRGQLNKLRVVALVPAYNEEPELLKACIRSLLWQYRRIDHIEVVDDGSTVDYTSVREWLPTVERYGTTLKWTRTANGGKRHAQAVGIRNNPDADIYLTVDSDTVLDPNAVLEGLYPFADQDIKAVAGICLPINVTNNLLTRFSGLWEMTWQLIERSAQSTMGCVTVNSGILALYRADIIRKNLDGYLNETFMGKQVKYSDDSLMTLYCLAEGKTIQQPSCIGFSAIPNKYSHYIRRYIRWMRGSFIRTFWRFKYLPMNSLIYWWHMWRWFQFGMSTFVTIYIFFSGVAFHHNVLPYMALIVVVMSYVQTLRYFTIKRSDVSAWQQFKTWLTAPVAALWSMTVLRTVKWYAYATVANNGWGTRQKQELSVLPVKV